MEEEQMEKGSKVQNGMRRNGMRGRRQWKKEENTKQKLQSKQGNMGTCVGGMWGMGRGKIMTRDDGRGVGEGEGEVVEDVGEMERG